MGERKGGMTLEVFLPRQNCLKVVTDWMDFKEKIYETFQIFSLGDRMGYH